MVFIYSLYFSHKNWKLVVFIYSLYVCWRGGGDFSHKNRKLVYLFTVCMTINRSLIGQNSNLTKCKSLIYIYDRG